LASPGMLTLATEEPRENSAPDRLEEVG